MVRMHGAEEVQKAYLDTAAFHTCICPPTNRALHLLKFYEVFGYFCLRTNTNSIKSVILSLDYP